jgi:hypothetical protein
MKRPVGVTIIAWIAIIVGVLQLLGGLGVLGAVTGVIPGLTEAITGLMPGAGAAALFSAIGIGAGVAAVVMALLSIVFGVGALGLRPWAWILGVVLYAITVILGLVALVSEFSVAVLITTLVAGAILAYLFTHDVRVAFQHEHGLRRTTGTGGPVVHT